MYGKLSQPDLTPILHRYLGVPRSIMGLTVLPMAVTIAGFVFCLVRDAHLKRQEKRKLKDLQALEFSVSEAL